MKYTAVIRTLGTAGAKYQETLKSIMSQSIRPEAILVYIAEGYQIPCETIGFEQYVYVKKGMVAQRALAYDEVKTEYCLFLDDDVYLPLNAVQQMYQEMKVGAANVISPCTFANHEATWLAKLRLTMLGKEVCRLWDNNWAFKVLRTAGFSYNNAPIQQVYKSQTNAGPCFFCKKEDFLKVAFQEELWLDDAPYALPEDQVMFYKMYKKGLKILTSFDTGIVHLDAGSTMSNSKERLLKLIFSEYRNKLIFWHRFIYLPEKVAILKIWSIIAIIYAYSIQALKYSILFIFGRGDCAKAFCGGVKEAISFIKSTQYKELPRI